MLFFFDGRNLPPAALMPAAGKLGGEPGVDDAHSLIRLENAGAQSENVGIVVLTAHLGLIFGTAIGGADAVPFVGCDRHANAAAADQDAKIGALLADVVRDGAGIVRVINRFRRGSAFIADLNALLLKVLFDLIFQLVACVIGA